VWQGASQANCDAVDTNNEPHGECARPESYIICVSHSGGVCASDRATHTCSTDWYLHGRAIDWDTYTRATHVHTHRGATDGHTFAAATNPYAYTAAKSDRGTAGSHG
jgi:hypothetical protein